MNSSEDIRALGPDRQRVPKRVLVIGDWLVDEYWVTGVHRSPTSSGVGRAHLRALHSPQSIVQAIGGAGRAASVLYRAQVNELPLCELVGIGFWNSGDTEVIAAMLDSNPQAMHNPHLFAHKSPPAVPRCTLISLANVIPELQKQPLAIGTARLIHIYQHTGSKLELIERIDWQTRVRQYIVDEDCLRASPFLRYFADNPPEAILVADYGKGVVSESLIRWLRSVAPHAKWYISTKDWNPPWIDALSSAEVRLIVVTQVAAQLAVAAKDVDAWIIRDSYVGDHALEKIDGLAIRFRGPIVIVQPGGWSLIVRDRGLSRSPKGLFRGDVGPDRFEGLPQTSYFTAALVAHLLHNPNIEFHALVQWADDFAQAFIQYESGRLQQVDCWTPVGQPRVQVAITAEGERDSFRHFDINSERLAWATALSKCGVLTDENGTRMLQLWRAMTEVDGYVCCVKRKRAILQHLAGELKTFAAGGRRHHKSYLLVASPGSGKTFLVRRLAKVLGLRFLAVNITQMLSKLDILDCFDTIVTMQAQGRDEAVLVFVDEINAKLNGQLVYDSFLAPLEEGIYVRSGKAFKVDPCLWVFAGTENPKQMSAGHERSSKAEDFLSRLSSPPLDLTINVDDVESMKQARLEKVYQGVVMLQSVFPDVVSVSERVLHAFHSLPPSLGVRDLENFVRSFTGVQYGEVRSRNIPERLLHTLVDDMAGYEDASDSLMIQIVR